MKKWISKNIKRNNIKNRKDIIESILDNRKLKKNEYEKFLKPEYKDFHNPFLLKGMKKAIERIKNAYEEDERICIYGDYDVDGTSATSVLLLAFKEMGFKNVDYYIPNRIHEGYGLNNDAIKKIKDRGNRLIITVDCGITSFLEADYAKEIDIDLIITDHHECEESLPQALAIINSKQSNCKYPFKSLCGAGIAFKLIQALNDELKQNIDVNKLLPIVAMATVCDVVTLKDENRLIVKKGLELIKKTKIIGLKKLIDICGIEDNIRAYHFGYVLGPRINAGGRLGFSYKAVELFTCEDQDIAFGIANFLDEQNKIRQDKEKLMNEEAIYEVENNKSFDKQKVILIDKENWNHGIVGIVSSRITEKYYKPSILLCKEGQFAKGSARSIKNFNIYEALLYSKEYIYKFGGHKQAAGLTVEIKNIEKLREKINEYANRVLTKNDMIEEISYEVELEPNLIGFNLINDLKSLEPFGMGNPTPKFLIKEFKVSNLRFIGKDKDHVSFELLKDNKKFKVIAFNKAYLFQDFDFNTFYDGVITLDINKYNGVESIQLNLIDIKKVIDKKYLYDLDFDSYRPTNIKRIKNVYCDLDIDFDETLRNGKNLILVNDYTNLKDLIYILERKILDYNIFIHKIKSEIKNKSNLDIILYPSIENLSLKEYNNIVSYDYIVGSCAKNSDFADFSLIKPIRKDFVNFYKVISKNKLLRHDFIKLTKELNLNPFKFLNILNTFKDLDMIDFDFFDKEIYIQLKDIKEKKDLNTANTMIYIDSLI
ncbi:single-stranded-DNA-specific exonuclease RecJ [Peptostreptococcaceae bacterium AGR-M142]